MSCIVEINTVETMNMVCSSECGFLKNPDNSVRINKAEVQSYEPMDVPPSYEIHFTMKNGMVIIWTFLTMTARDTALANVDEEMNTQTV